MRALPRSLPLLTIHIAAGLCLMAAPPTLTIEQAVQAALRNYPSIRVSQEQVDAASAGIRLARTAYLPRVDGFAQVNRATRNNVFGLLLPQSVIPSISGPVIGTNNLGTVWGSAIGALVTWEPFDFGLRKTNVEAANATRAQSEAALQRTQFDVAVTAADAYLTLLAAQETIRAAQAGVDRSATVVNVISALVNAQLRPGADQSRAEAELAAARTQLIQAQEAADLARATLAQFVGGEPSQLAISTGALLTRPADSGVPAPNFTANPALVEQNAAVRQAQAQLRVLERSYFPRFYLQGAAYSRGTGAKIDGTRLGGLSGLGPDVQNYALGFSVTFPILDLPAIHAREAAQSATIRSQTAKSEQIAVDLRAQWNRAVATLTSARRIAENTPVQLSSARAAAEQATARYQAGLGNIAEVAEAQRLLTQAEIDDALARLSIWRGLLAIATVAGDIQPFLAEASR
jgi:outer membrane protein TolC